MTKTLCHNDVFLSATDQDAGVSEAVQRALESAGLEVFSLAKLEPGDQIGDLIREALADSRVLVTILTRSALTSAWINTLFGAAWGLNKPVFILLDGVSPKEVPSLLRRFQIRPIGEFLEVISELEKLIRGKGKPRKTG